MRATKTESLKNAIANAAAKAYVGFKSGEFNTTRQKMKTSMESLGIVDSVLVVNKTIYVIAHRAKALSKNIQMHEGEAVEYYNCIGDVKVYSPFELLMPVINIDLSRDTLDPRSLVGGSVLVSEINGQAIKAEFVGELAELNESPLDVPRALFKSIRNYVGAYTALNDKDERVQSIVQQFGLGNVVDEIYKTSAMDWIGNVVSYETDGDYTKDSHATKQEGRLTIKAVENLTRHLNGEDMKTKLCHNPVKLFTAR